MMFATRSLYQGLVWDAPAVEAVAAELVPLDEADPRAERGRPRGRDQPCRPGPPITTKS
jgi:hypothetical protein